jgi:hypothetical protein
MQEFEYKNDNFFLKAYIFKSKISKSKIKTHILMTSNH